MTIDLEQRVSKLEDVIHSIYAAAQKNKSAVEISLKSVDPHDRASINAHNIKVMGDYIIAINSALRAYHK